MAYRYVPLLRTKSGEVTALLNLTAQAKSRIFPVIHVVAKPPGAFVAKFASACPQAVALDGLFSFAASGSANVFADMLKDLRAANVPAIPSIDIDADPAYIAAAGKFVTKAHPTVVVKVRPAQLSGLATWVSSCGWAPGNVDLIINADHISGLYGAQFVGYIAHVLKTDLPTPTQWRSVTLASSAAPKDASFLSHGRNVVPRHDWDLWQKVRAAVGFPLDYGDFGTSHPDLSEPPGVAMVNATVSVRYTVDDNWIVLKGRSTRGAHGQPMAAQYKKHAKALITEPQFGQLTGCWGDQRIQTIATTATSSGNRTSWVEISANRHLSLIADRLP